MEKRAEPNGFRVLVVEDEYLVADDISETLEELGYQVAGPAATIGEAIALIEGGPLDCALLDANLDGLSSAPIAPVIPFVRTHALNRYSVFRSKGTSTK